ncbi:MAG: lipoprotein insertase outer membrane protein LolB [Gallionella sp.]|jgi:outer membrane lipoprotein LolB|nr:lipoprotein insertase outer membrane protein LolB [Gallionella sp.]MCK9353802.1 lipoprotein insertase outer membrane protein LolB [Gallionella sp.]
MRLIALILLVLLGGCASPPTAPAARPSQLEVAAFALNGRIAIKHNGTRHSAGVRWVHLSQSDELLLQGPLGQTAARVYRDAQGATLDDGSKHYEAADAETLMQQVLGWQLPLGGLRLWVLGQAAEGEAQIERDERGRIVLLLQDGWEVRYLRYDGDGMDSLPSRLQLSRNELQVQLLIDEWEWEKP